MHVVNFPSFVALIWDAGAMSTLRPHIVEHRTILKNLNLTYMVILINLGHLCGQGFYFGFMYKEL